MICRKILSLRLALCALALCSAGMSAGCIVVAAGAAGAAGVAYVKGDLEATVTDKPPEVAKAAEKALSNLQIRQISSGSSAVDAVIIGRTARDERVKITAEATPEGGSLIHVRVGVFGDQSLSQVIYNELRQRLPSKGAPSKP